MKTQARRYLFELGSVIALYTIMLIISITLLQTYPTTPFRPVIALLPMLPALGVPFVIVRQLRRMDEMQRQVQLEAFGFALAGTAILTFGYGFLEIVGFPRISAFVVWPIIAVLWIVGLALANRRYQ